MASDFANKFNDAGIVAFALAGDEWPRSAFSPTLIPDAWFALLSKSDGRRWIVPSGEDPRPERGDTLTLMRNRAIVVPVDVADGVSKDQRAITCRSELLVRWPMREDAVDAFRRGPLAENPLRLARLAELVCGHGAQRGLSRFIAMNEAETLISADRCEALAELIRGDIRQFLFENGLTIERVASLTCDCPSLRKERQRRQATSARIDEIKSRELVEQAALEAARRRVGELSGLFDKLRAAAGPDGRQWRELLPALAPNERIHLLENLWRITPDRSTARYVIVVAGHECVWLDPRQLRPIEHRVTLPRDLGKARSVTFDAKQNALLIGAADGICAVSAVDGEIQRRFRVPDETTVQTGFNAATIFNGRVFASHSQRGVWSWSLDGGDGRAEFSPVDGLPRRIRCVTHDDAGVFFAADDKVMMLTPGENVRVIAETGRGEIRSLTIAGNHAYFGTDDGMLLRDRLDGTQGVCECIYRVAAPIESISARRWTDMTELVIPAGPAGVVGLFVEEGAVGRLLDAPRQTIRRAWACDDLVVAMRDLRDRLILLHADDVVRAGKSVSMIDLLGRDIEDACIVTQSAAESVPSA